MARYWVPGGSGNWNATDTNNWSATSGGASGASVPTSSDDVFFDAASGAAVVTQNAAAAISCKSLTCTGFTGTLNFNTGQSVYVYGSMLLVAGMTYTHAGGTALVFRGNGATCNLTTAGKTLGHVYCGFSSEAPILTLQDAMTSIGTVSLNSGTLNTNGQTCSWESFSSSNSAARTLTLGASAITLTTSGTAWECSTNTNMTVTANTATITMTGAGAQFRPGSVVSGVTGYGGTIVFSGSGTAIIITSAGSSFGNITRTGTAAKTDGFQIYGSTTNPTVTGTLTINGNSATNRVLVSSETVGTARTITAAAVSLSNCDFMDITGAGAAAPFTGTSIGDCGGNTQITPTTPATQTHTASAGGSWSDASKWTSRVPLPQDNVIVDVNTSGTLTADMPRLGKSLTFTGFAGTYAHASATLYGSLTLGAGMTVSNSSTFILAGRGSFSITSNGTALSNQGVTITAPGGTYTLTDALTLSSATKYLSVTNGTLVTAGYAVTCAGLSMNGSGTKALTAGASVFTLTTVTAADNVLSIAASGSTISAASASFVVSGATSNARTFGGGGQTYGTLTYTVASSTGALTISGANTFTTINVSGGARTLKLPSSTTTTVTNFNVYGASGALVTLEVSTPGTFATLAKAGGGYAYGLDYLSISDIHATP